MFITQHQQAVERMSRQCHVKGLTCYVLQQVVDVLIALCVICKASGSLTEATGQSPLPLG